MSDEFLAASHFLFFSQRFLLCLLSGVTPPKRGRSERCDIP